MFTPPRFVVVDDRPEHLTAILRVLQELGAPCRGVVYSPEQGLNRENFEGVRAIFMDLYLTVPVQTSDNRHRFALIASLLEDNVSPAGGPFVLVVWTQHDTEVEKLRDYLDEPGTIDSEKPHARPLTIVGLPKGRYINEKGGELLKDKADALRQAVEAAVGEQPQLAALLSWEADVQAAGGETLATLMELVADEKRYSASFGEGLDEVLSRLASAAVGGPHVAADPRAAITSALAPILADRVVHRQASEAASEAWQRALNWTGKGNLEPAASGKVNRMLHVAVPSSENILPTDWGAVVEFPGDWWQDHKLRSCFGVTRGQLLGGEYKLSREDRERCRPRLVRIGAACDYAQKRPGPITYLFGLEIPVEVDDRRRVDDEGREKKLRASEWPSPPVPALIVEPSDGPFIFAVNVRYSLNVVPDDTKEWQPVYRLREQLLMHLISHAGSYLVRPGIVQL